MDVKDERNAASLILTLQVLSKYRPSKSDNRNWSSAGGLQQWRHVNTPGSRSDRPELIPCQVTHTKKGETANKISFNWSVRQTGDFHVTMCCAVVSYPWVQLTSPIAGLRGRRKRGSRHVGFPAIFLFTAIREPSGHFESWRYCVTACKIMQCNIVSQIA